ncbi:MAG: isochorismate synthase [Opitutaceae bacterium]|nr:isochorismate synthase [Opitutaceae bacterium]
MLVLPLHPANDASPEALMAFLRQCRDAAVRDGHAKLVSISLAVDALDPLAVLESIFEPHEPHFYAERPGSGTAIAGAEVAVAHEAHGARRFADVQRWVGEVFAHTVAVGDVAAPFGGPHVFAGFAFHDEIEAGEPFPAAYAFVPRWQVALAGTTTTAVANLWVTAEADLGALALRVWRAHQKFTRFEYQDSEDNALGVGGVPSPRGSVQRGEGTPPAWQQRETGDYRAAVARALARIAAGDFKKIVLARAQELTADRPLHPLRMLNGLRQRFPDCYAFSFTRGQGPSFIGASPERLVRVSKGRLETEALAGSIRRGASASEDAALAGALLRSEKDLREHREVLDDIVARLAPLGIQPEHAALPQIRRLANVQHLDTPVHAALPEHVSLLDVIGAMHPTPAVGGSPREAAVAAIRELEGFPRGLYAGALGWLNARGGGEFFVGIRSALVEGARARVYAGAGIVAGSTPEKEFSETELKFQAILDALSA